MAFCRFLPESASTGRVRAAFLLGLDYLLIVAYAAALSLACAVAAGWYLRCAAWLSALGPIASWSAVVAGGFDTVENAALLQWLLVGGEGAPVTAWWCATLKFLLLAGGLGSFALGLIVRLLPGKPAEQGGVGGGQAPETTHERSA